MFKKSSLSNFLLNVLLPPPEPKSWRRPCSILYYSNAVFLQTFLI